MGTAELLDRDDTLREAFWGESIGIIDEPNAGKTGGCGWGDGSINCKEFINSVSHEALGDIEDSSTERTGHEGTGTVHDGEKREGGDIKGSCRGGSTRERTKIDAIRNVATILTGRKFPVPDLRPLEGCNSRSSS
jgi:hypothetical protein